MEIGWLIALLKEHGGSPGEMGERIVSAAGDDSQKSLEASFRIALGTGLLNRASGEQLCSAIERMTAPGSLAALSFPDDPSLANLQREVDALSEQHRRMKLTHADIAASREAVSALANEVIAVKQKVREREEEVNALQQHMNHLEAVIKEFRQ